MRHSPQRSQRRCCIDFAFFAVHYFIKIIFQQPWLPPAALTTPRSRRPHTEHPTRDSDRKRAAPEAGVSILSNPKGKSVARIWAKVRSTEARYPLIRRPERSEGKPRKECSVGLRDMFYPNLCMPKRHSCLKEFGEVPKFRLKK